MRSGSIANLRGRRAYDPLGRLWEVNGVKEFRRFLYDGDALVAEYDQWGNMLKRYVHGQGADTPQVWFEGAGISASERRFLFTNHQGSVTAIADGWGNTIAINRYDEYGIPDKENIGRFQYTGQAWLEDLGMYHYKARIYSPTLGRFLQTDPIGYEDQINLYAYVGNDPVNNRDPTGMECANSSAATAEQNATNDCENADPIVAKAEETKSAEHSDDRGTAVGTIESGKIPLDERLRADCLAAGNDSSTPVASTIASGAEVVANVADAAAAIAVFVPGGQGFAGGAKLTSYVAQGVQGVANWSIARSTGNYSALRSQAAGFVAGSVFGAGIGRIANSSLKGTGTFSKSESGAFGDAFGAIFGDGASSAACGR